MKIAFIIICHDGDDDDYFMKFKKRSLAKTFKNTSFRLFALQPSTGKMIIFTFLQ